MVYLEDKLDNLKTLVEHALTFLAGGLDNKLSEKGESIVSCLIKLAKICV